MKQTCEIQNIVYIPITPTDILSDGQARQIVEFLIVMEVKDLDLMDSVILSVNGNIDTANGGFTFKPRVIGK